MNIARYLQITALIAGLSFAGLLQASAIYPIDQAAILAGSKFDIKIEFDQILNPDDIVLELNSAPISTKIKNKPEFISNEAGKGSSIVTRDVQIQEPGRYQITARIPQEKLQVNWDVYPSGPKRVKNVILFIGDGMTIANRTTARLLSKGIQEGRYQGRLAFDDMPHTAMIGTSGSDSLITDSANSMSAYTTGHKTAVNVMGVYVSRSPDNFSHPRVETITELIKRKTKMSVGIVSDAELQDATPGAMVAHTRRRADKQYIADQLLSSGAEVILGGGAAYFYPQSAKESKRKDENNLIEEFKSKGYQVAFTQQ